MSAEVNRIEGSMTTTDQLRDELMTSWRAGVCDGLELAAQMAQGLLDHPDTPACELDILAALRDAIRTSGLECAAEGRTR